MLQMTEEEFRERFKKSPVKRAKRRGLLRNVAAALSSLDDPAAEAALVEALNHEEPLGYTAHRDTTAPTDEGRNPRRNTTPRQPATGGLSPAPA